MAPARGKVSGSVHRALHGPDHIGVELQDTVAQGAPAPHPPRPTRRILIAAYDNAEPARRPQHAQHEQDRRDPVRVSSFIPQVASISHRRTRRTTRHPIPASHTSARAGALDNPLRSDGTVRPSPPAVSGNSVRRPRRSGAGQAEIGRREPFRPRPSTHSPIQYPRRSA